MNQLYLILSFITFLAATSFAEDSSNILALTFKDKKSHTQTLADWTCWDGTGILSLSPIETDVVGPYAISLQFSFSNGTAAPLGPHAAGNISKDESFVYTDGIPDKDIASVSIHQTSTVIGASAAWFYHDLTIIKPGDKCPNGKKTISLPPRNLGPAPPLPTIKISKGFWMKLYDTKEDHAFEMSGMGKRWDCWDGEKSLLIDPVAGDYNPLQVNLTLNDDQGNPLSDPVTQTSITYDKTKHAGLSVQRPFTGAASFTIKAVSLKEGETVDKGYFEESMYLTNVDGVCPKGGQVYKGVDPPK